MEESEFRGECIVWKDELCVCPYRTGTGTGPDRGDVESNAGDKGIDGRRV